MPAITSETTRATTTTAAALARATPAPSHNRCLRPIRATVIAAATAAASMLTSAAATLAAAATTATSATSTTTTTISNYNYHNSIISLTQQPDTLQQRLQPDVVDTDTGGGSRLGVSVNVALPQRLANNLLNNFLPAIDAVTNATTTTIVANTSNSPSISSSNGSSSSSRSSSSSNGGSVTYPTFRPPSIESLVASSAEDLSNFHDVSFDIFDDDDDLFGSPLAFDASDNGLWNGRFVPPPPRPPFLVDEPVLSDGLTTCDLCSWAMPTKSTFMFEGTIEKASELGWPLTLIIVSVLSALLGAIVMVTVVRCRRKKPTNNRNETHVQWWSRNKRPNGSNNNNHLRRSNIYTAHPADSIRGLQQPSLSAASSLTTMTAMGASAGGPLHSNAVTPNATQPPPQLPHQQQQYYHHPYQQHTLQSSLHRSLSGQQHAPDYEYEHEYHQPQELQLQLQQQQQQHQHQRQSSSSMSSLSDSPTLPVANISKPRTLQLQHQPMQHQQQQQHLAHNVADGVTVGFVGGGGGMGVGVGIGTTGTGTTTGLGVGLTSRRGASELSEDTSCRWPSATIVVAS